MRATLLSLLLLLPASESLGDDGRSWVLASWNLQWLLSPETLHQARRACRAGGRATIPCDVAWELSRTSSDIAALRRIAGRLDADVVAVQEVERVSLLHEVFPGAGYCLTDGPGRQQVGVVVRSGVPYRCLPDLKALGLGGRHRYGAQALLFPGDPRETLLLAVHLKSGCAARRLDSSEASCRVLSRQLPLVSEWLAEADRRGQPALVVGDFNRVAPLPLPVAVPGQVEAGGCAPGQIHAMPIDHVVLGERLQRANPGAGARRLAMAPRELRRYRLSDHCPLLVRIKSPRAPH